MEKGNVLVIGYSGVGKSTLINSVLGENVAKTSFGTTGTTRELQIYGNEETPFRVIDTIGFEPTWLKERLAISAVRKWSREAAQKGDGNKDINVIWICVDGTSGKLFPKVIEDISSATKIWKSVPIIVVITKSYSEADIENNKKMVMTAFAKQKISSNLQDIHPVVAAPYIIDECHTVPPKGIVELIDLTNNLMPNGIKAAKDDIKKFKLNRKRALAQTTIAASTVGGVAAAVLLPSGIPDASVLTPLEMAEVNGLATVYGINKDEKLKSFIKSIIEAGTVGVAAKTLISAIKAIPGINIAAALLNGLIAGVFVASIGEASSYLFEQVYLGNKSLEDIDWAKKIVESKVGGDLFKNVESMVKKLSDKVSPKDIAEAIIKMFTQNDKAEA